MSKQLQLRSITSEGSDQPLRNLLTQIMVSIAAYDVRLPSFDGDVDTKLQRLLLNEEQLDAIMDPSLKKLIDGEF